MPAEISRLTPWVILLIIGGVLLLLNSVLVSQLVGQGRQVFQSLTGRALVSDDLLLYAFALKPKGSRREKKRSPP